MRIAKWIIMITTAVIATPLLIAFIAWMISLPAWQLGDEDCLIETVSNAQYRNLLERANRQSWTVRPGLSDGIFWPSDRGLKPPGPRFEQALGTRLREAVDELVGEHPLADMELAAAHALMRSIGADLVSTFEILGFPERDRHIVQFRYFLPQRRFAPLCLLCFIWRYTTITVSFQRDPATTSYPFDGITLLHGNLKYDPNPTKERNVNNKCPAFPVPGGLR